MPNGFDSVIHFYKLSHTTYTFRIAQGVCAKHGFHWINDDKISHQLEHACPPSKEIIITDPEGYTRNENT
jgi:hypothetical protein